ncbi:MAG TPA: acyltransferase family protein [Kofleriaceae bacterium]|nr:acyltransferase family protein [Kofleriaceae bacterium]
MVQPIAQPPKGRVEWVDYAKGICIFFVVMLHVNDVVQERAGRAGWLEEVVTFARPFRMPDFFLIAGLFLANAMRRPWRRYLDAKVVHFFYFYGLWMTLQFAVFNLQYLVRHDASALEIALAYLRRWIDPVGPLWFIHMLPVFFLVTRLTRRVPPWWIWLGAAALHSLQLRTGSKVMDELGSRYVYFYSGYVLAPYVFRIASWAHARVWATLGYLACWGIVNALVVMAGWAALPFVSLALGYVGALAVILAAVMLSRLSWTEPLRYLGQSSIVVYLGDFWVALIVVRALEPVIPDLGACALISTLLTVIGTIVMWRVALRTPARFMYERPRRLRLDAAPPSRGEPAPTLAAPALGE